MSNKMFDFENKMIQDVLDNFDFKKCESAMKKLNWKWATIDSSPNVEILKQSASYRLKDAMELAKKGKCSKSTYFVSSGGLKANAWVNKYGHVTGLRLEFVLTDWDTDGDF